MKNLMRRSFAVLIILAMCLGVLPAGAFAANAGEGSSVGVGDLCPVCENNKISISKDNPNLLICDYCGKFSQEINGNETEDKDSKPNYCTGGNHVIVNGKCRYCGYVEQQTSEPTNPGTVYPPSWYHTENECTFADWLHDDSTDEHYRHCTNLDRYCPRPDMEIREKCNYVADTNGFLVCEVCGYVKSPVTLGPGSEDDKQCPEGMHEFGTVGTSISEGAHRLTCVNCGYSTTETCEWSILKENGQPVAHYCSVCGNTKSIVTPEKDYCTDLGKGHDFAPAKEVLSEDGQSVLTTLVCKTCGYTQITTICNAPTKVTVHYVFEDGTTAAPDAVQAVIKGSEYSISSPEISGYTPDLAVVEGVCQSGDGAEFTVVYSALPETYTLTIKYEFPGGEEVFPTYTAELKAGEEYQVESPTLAGYEPEQSVVKGVMPAADEKVTVKYSLIEYTWTIYCYYDGANMPFDTIEKTFTVETKSLDDVTAPVVPGWNADQDVVKAPDLKPLADKVSKVIYTPVVYTWTIQYEYEDGTPAAETAEVKFTVKDIESGILKDIQSPVIDGWNADRDVVKAPSSKDDLHDQVIVVKYSEKKAVEVIVKYLDGDEEVASETRGKLFEDGEASVAPDAGQLPEGYELVETEAKTATFDQPKVTFQVKTVDYTWTIRYEYEDGTQAAETFRKTFTVKDIENGALQAVTSPVLNGWNADALSVAAPDAVGSVEVTVTYTAVPTAPTTPTTPVSRSYPLTINVYVDGELASTASRSVTAGTAIDNPGTPRDGYTVTVEGYQSTMPSRSLTINVYYLSEELEVEEDPTPLAPAPEEDPEEFEIEEEPTPLAPGPQEQEKEEEVEIEDTEVPLADVPKTGDSSHLWKLTALLSALGLALLTLGGKKREADGE